MPSGNLPNAAEAAGAGFDVGFQHGIHFLALPEIGVADDSGGDPGFHPTALGLGGDPGDEFRLPDRLHLLRSGCAVGPEALEENGRDDVVARSGVRQQLIQKIRVASMVPQMMMRIDDGKLRFQDIFGQPSEPRRVGEGVAQNQFRQVGHVC